MYALPHFVFVLKFLSGNQDPPSKFRPGFEEFEAWGRILQVKTTTGLKGQTPARSSAVSDHGRVTELNFWKRFLLSSASKTVFK